MKFAVHINRRTEYGYELLDFELRAGQRIDAAKKAAEYLKHGPSQADYYIGKAKEVRKALGTTEYFEPAWSRVELVIHAQGSIGKGKVDGYDSDWYGWGLRGCDAEASTAADLVRLVKIAGAALSKYPQTAAGILDALLADKACLGLVRYNSDCHEHGFIERTEADRDLKLPEPERKEAPPPATLEVSELVALRPESASA